MKAGKLFLFLILFVLLAGCPNPETTTTTSSTTTTSIGNTTTSSTTTTSIGTTTTTSSTTTTSIGTTTTTSTTTIPSGTGKISFTLTNGKDDLTHDALRGKKLFVRVFDESADFKTATPITTSSVIIAMDNYDNLNVQTIDINNGKYDLQFWLDKNGNEECDNTDIIGKKTGVVIIGNTEITSSAPDIRLTIKNVPQNIAGKFFGFGVFNEGETIYNQTTAVEGNSFALNTGTTSINFIRTFLEGGRYFISGAIDINNDNNIGNSGDMAMEVPSDTLLELKSGTNEYLLDYNTLITIP